MPDLCGITGVNDRSCPGNNISISINSNTIFHLFSLPGNNKTKQNPEESYDPYDRPWDGSSSANAHALASCSLQLCCCGTDTERDDPNDRFP